MKEEQITFLAGVAVAAIIGCLITGIRDGVHEREAVQRGQAEYILNPKDGTSTFTWRTNCVCK